MKKLGIFVALTAFLIMTAIGPVHAGELKTVTFKVKGMTCALCGPAVKKALTRVKGVKTVEVSVKEKKAVVEYEEGEAGIEDMIRAVGKAGYKASLPERR